MAKGVKFMEMNDQNTNPKVVEESQQDVTDIGKQPEASNSVEETKPSKTYFKSFESEPVFKQQYVDGVPIDENIYTTNRKEEVESYVEILLQITKEDCRDFYSATTGINDAKINTISLCTAWKKEVDGKICYQDIRPLTKYNFPTELLIDTTKGIDIIYHIYY